MLRASSGALRLYAISTRPASTATVAVFKDSLSFSTELSLHRQRRAQGSEATGREVSHGLTAKTANNRFTVLRPWYGLSTLSTRTLGYALGRSGSARRDTHGQLHAVSGGASLFPASQWLSSFSREMPVHRCHARARPNALAWRRWRAGRLTHSPRGARGRWQAIVDMQSAPPASWSSPR